MRSTHPSAADGGDITPRQRQVIICAAIGMTNRQIADDLFISARSVERDIAEACEIFAVPNRTALVLAAYRAEAIRDEHLEERM